MNTSPLFIALAGNIGAGKTTYTRLLAEHYGWQPYFEPVLENPYLDDFYEDMERWAFQLQIYFLAKRFQSQVAIQKSRQPVIQDRTIYEDVEIFAATLHKQGKMQTRDFRTYSDLFAEMVAFLRTPDLVIYLKASPDELLERIRERGRPSERTIPRSYLEELNRAYEDWIRRYSSRHPVLILNSSEYPPQKAEAVFGLIDDALRGLTERS